MREKCLYIFLAAYHIVFFAIVLTLMIISIIAYNEYSDSLIDYKYILSNWDQHPTINLRVTTAQCNDNETLLSQFTWEGTQNGCDCRKATGGTPDDSAFTLHYIIYTNQICNNTLLKLGCTTIPGQNARNFTKFADPTSSYGISYCGQQLNTLTFVNSIPLTNSCNFDQKSCGEGVENQFCYPIQQECPILYMNYASQTKLSVEEYITVENTNDQIKIARDKDIAILPIAEYRIAEQGVCMRNQEQSITPGRKDYVLSKVPRSNCERDSRFELLYEVDEYTLYKVNGALDLQQLTDYVISSEYKWGFYIRPYISWKLECRSRVHEFYDDKNNLDSISDQLLIIRIVTVAWFSLITCAMAIASFVYRRYPIIALLQIIFQFASLIVDATLNIILFEQLRNEQSFLSFFIHNQCSDQTTNDTLSNVYGILSGSVYKRTLLSIIFFSISFGFIFLKVMMVLIMWLYSKYKEEQIWQEQVIQQAQNQHEQITDNDKQIQNKIEIG